MEECSLDCGELCNHVFETDQSCNAYIFDESNNVCTRALYEAEPSLELKGTGLRVAWSSNSGTEMSAIDGNENTLFQTGTSETLPWLAIDLVWPEQVKKVEIIKTPKKEKLTHDIEVRVGNEKPFKDGFKGKTKYTTNSVCGVFKGPGRRGIESSVTCSTPLTGRYVTLQKIVPSTYTYTVYTTDGSPRNKTKNNPLNFMEVVIDSSPVETGGGKFEILLRQEPYPGQCTSEHPYAISLGESCCSVGSSASYWSSSCKGKKLACFKPPCLNFQYMKP